MASFADSSDMVNRFDERKIGELLDDTDNRVAAVDFSSNGKMTAALDDATAEIKSAIMRGNRYTDADLALLSAADTAILKRICCVFAYAFLVARRGYNASELKTQVPFYKEYKDYLELLAGGERILNLETAKVAGQTTTAVIGKNISMLSGNVRIFGNKGGCQ